MSNPKGRTLLVRLLVVCAILGQISKHFGLLSCDDLPTRWMAESGSVRFILSIVGILILVGGLEESEGTAKGAVILSIYYFCSWLLTALFVVLFGGSSCFYGIGGPLFSLLYLGSQEGSHRYWWIPFAVLVVLIPVSPELYFVLQLSGIAVSFLPLNSSSFRGPVEDFISRYVDPGLDRFFSWAGYIRFGGYNIVSDTSVSISFV